VESKDKEEIVRNYEKLLAQYGDDPRSCQWRDGSSQDLRFKILVGIADLHRMSVLDLGCGKADLFHYLSKRGVSVEYTGYDISPAMVDFVKCRDPLCRVFVRDILTDGVGGDFDYCLISGIFNNKISDNWSFLTDTLKALWQHVKCGIAFNLITSYVDYEESHLYYVDPRDVYDWVKRHLTRFVTLRSDYLPFEYTIYAFKKS